MTSQTDHSLRITRTFDGPIDRVWQAITDAAWIARWWGPAPEWTAVVDEWDLRVGGRYRVTLTSPEGDRHVCFGEFTEIGAPTTIVYTFSWESDGPPLGSRIHYLLSDNDGRTVMEFRQEGLPTEESRDGHEDGWTGSFASLERELAR